MKKLKNIIYYFFFFYSLNAYADTSIYEIKAKIINYEKNKNTIIATGDAEAKNQENKKIFSDKITYNKDLGLITTEGHSSFFDNNNLSIFAEFFEYDTKLRTILATKNVIIKLNEETFEFNDFKYYELNQSGSGNKFKGKLKDGSTVISESAELSQQSGIKTLTKAKYTPCKETNDKNNEFCPSWSAISSTAVHDKEAQTITYKNAFLNLKNIPVMYVPYLNVPDPTVKRQTGFLSPSFQKLSQIATTFKLPYFFAISDDKDLTITPIFYSKENNIYAANYRQQFKNSYLEIDASFTNGYDNLNLEGRTSGSRNHLFADFKGKYKNYLLDDTDVILKLQNVNNSTYLLVNKINTNLVKNDLRNLENSFEINSYGQKKSLNFKVASLKNLDSTSQNQYEYIAPQIQYNTYIDTNYHQISFSSSFLAKNFNTNQNQENLINKLDTNSFQYIFNKLGIGSVLKTNITNININNDNVTGQRKSFFSENYFTLAFDNSYPLFKKNYSLNISENLTPRVFVKYTTGNISNQQSNDKILTYSDIYSMDRMNNTTNPETGFSIGAGFDWDVIKKNTENQNLFKSKFSAGQVFRNSNYNMPTTSSLQNTSSDIVGSYNLSYYIDNNSSQNVKNSNSIQGLPDFSKNYLNFNYEFNINNDLSSINRNLFSLSSIYKSNYFAASFEEKKNEIGNSKSILLNFKKLIFDNYFFNIETKKNFKDNYTEYTNINFFKEDDCLKFGLGYGQQDYLNKDLTPSKTLFFFNNI